MIASSRSLIGAGLLLAAGVSLCPAPATAQFLGPVRPTVTRAGRGRGGHANLGRRTRAQMGMTPGMNAGQRGQRRAGAGMRGAGGQGAAAAGRPGRRAGRANQPYRHAPADLASELQALRERHPAAVAQLPVVSQSADRRALALVAALPQRAQWAYYLALEEYPRLGAADQERLRRLVGRLAAVSGAQQGALVKAVESAAPGWDGPGEGESPGAAATAAFFRLGPLLDSLGKPAAAR